MILIEKIKQDQLAARKAKDAVKSSILTTLIGEAEAIGKNDGNRLTTDNEVIALIKKFMKNNDDTKSMSFDAALVHKLFHENVILDNYLPEQLTVEELITYIKLRIIVNSVGTENSKVMGKVLGDLKKAFPGLYDGALASKIVKEILVKQ